MKVTALAWVAMIDSATACHGIVLPASRYLLTLLLLRPRQTPNSTTYPSAQQRTTQSAALMRGPMGSAGPGRVTAGFQAFGRQQEIRVSRPESYTVERLGGIYR